ncbi:MAG: right-handed parallel beta-helix repeat-containing protein [Anaerolineales bacterium]|nr:right-handed parallel beta-helix repeat-containing protein [Anaerolineales bacterium]
MKKALYQFISVFTAGVVILVSYHSVSASQNVSPVHAPKVYYVNPSGNDSNSGSSTAPFKTFSKAVSVLVAGDTLMVSGTFNNQTLIVAKSGTASAPITIVGNNAVINAQGSKINGINISGNYVNVSGFDVRGSTQHAILIGGKHIRFENSSVHHSVLDNGSNGNCSGANGWGSAVKLVVGAENITIRGNTVYENCGEGIAVTRGVNILVENNTVRDNFSVNIYIDNSPYVTIKNNTVLCGNTYLRDGNRSTGIAIGEESYSGWGAQRHHNYILNNYIEGCRDGIASWLPEAAGGKLKDSVISGNIIPSGTRRGITINSGNQNVLIENNQIFGGIYLAYPTGVTLKNNTITSGATSTPSRTPTATTVKSPTPTRTPTFTRTPTITVTPATFTPTLTFTPSKTPVVSHTATFEPTATPTSIDDLVIDDTDSSLVYSTGWEEITNNKAYNGSYLRNPKHNSSVSFTFVGESFGIIYTDGPSFRKMEVFVNGVLMYTVNRRAYQTRYQQRWDYPDLLPEGENTIKIVFTNGNGMFDGIVMRSFNGSVPFMKTMPDSTQTATSTASETPLSLPTATPTTTSPPPTETQSPTPTYYPSPTPTLTP